MTTVLGSDGQKFTCYQDDSPNLTLHVEVGDVLGACGTRSNKQLDIIGRGTEQSLLQISQSHFVVGGCNKNKIPANITLLSNGKVTNVSRVLHLYADISTSLSL